MNFFRVHCGIVDPTKLDASRKCLNLLGRKLVGNIYPMDGWQSQQIENLMHFALFHHENYDMQRKTRLFVYFRVLDQIRGVCHGQESFQRVLGVFFNTYLEVMSLGKLL